MKGNENGKKYSENDENGAIDKNSATYRAREKRDFPLSISIVATSEVEAKRAAYCFFLEDCPVDLAGAEGAGALSIKGIGLLSPKTMANVKVTTHLTFRGESLLSLTDYECFTMSKDTQRPTAHNEGTSDGPHVNMDPMMAIIQELQRRRNNVGNVTPNTQRGYGNLNLDGPYDISVESTYQLHEGIRHGGIGGRGNQRPHEEFQRDEAWHKENLGDNYGGNPYVGQEYLAQLKSLQLFKAPPWNKPLDLESLQVFNFVEQQHNFYP
ncbi:hypothetical protein M9H77_29438 [Catharanthus roseus]|uniref:Uncharacterized protein n=1 Tax=Catharanthus roseus TaxID=4058 RepID=A0ACB9ZVA8_CATRO|nr:hypothetical protein M9H77_29438 [Catharanthus roseus]